MESKLEFDEIWNDIKWLMDGMMVMVKDLARSKGLNPDELLDLNKSSISQNLQFPSLIPVAWESSIFPTLEAGVGVVDGAEQQSPLKLEGAEVAHNLFDEMPWPPAIKLNGEHVETNDFRSTVDCTTNMEVFDQIILENEPAQLLNDILIRIPDTNGDSALGAPGFADDNFQSHLRSIELHLNTSNTWSESAIKNAYVQGNLNDESKNDEQSKAAKLESIQIIYPIHVQVLKPLIKLALPTGIDAPNNRWSFLTEKGLYSYKMLLSRSKFMADIEPKGRKDDMSVIDDDVRFYFDPSGCSLSHMIHDPFELNDEHGDICVQINADDAFVKANEHCALVFDEQWEMSDLSSRPGSFLKPRKKIEDNSLNVVVLTPNKGSCVTYNRMGGSGYLLSSHSQNSHFTYSIAYEAWERKKLYHLAKGSEKMHGKCNQMYHGLDCNMLVPRTMFGRAKQSGIVYGSLKDMLGDEGEWNGENSKKNGGVTSVPVNVLEIYNEEIYDLLTAKESGGLGLGWTKVMATKVKLEMFGKKVKNASFIAELDATKIAQEIQKVEKLGIVISSYCNERSSRSHCMIILDVPTVGGRLMLMDTPDFENIEQAGRIGLEAIIQSEKSNQGNIILRRIVESIANGDSHVPFRDNKLTILMLVLSMLKDDLVATFGNKTLRSSTTTSWALFSTPEDKVSSAFALYTKTSSFSTSKSYDLSKSMNFTIPESSQYVLISFLTKLFHSTSNASSLILGYKLEHGAVIIQCAVGMANHQFIVSAENFVWDPGHICSDFSILEDKDVLKGRDLSGSKGFEGISHFVLFIKLFPVLCNYDITNYLLMS